MAERAVEVEDVWKRFHRGQLHDSLRDLIPALVSRISRRSSTKSGLGVNSFWALKDISFHVDHGEALGIIGPNGAGKSTMLKVLSRILKPNRGHIEINGRLNALIEIAAGFHGDLTGRENIYLNGSILGMKKQEVDRKLESIIEFSGVEPFIDTPVKRYSSGMQARLGFSVAAHLDPDILLVDEVLSVGDANFQNRCIANMNDKLKNGATIIFVSHNMKAVAELCPKTLVLYQGETAFLGRSEEGISRYMELSSNKNTEHADAAIEVTHSSWSCSGKEIIAPGDTFDLKIGLRFLRQITNPKFELVVGRMTDRLSMYHTSAQELGLPSRTYEEGEEIVLNFKGTINLLRGLYFVALRVSLLPQGTYVLPMQSICEFYVHENVSIWGMVDLNCTVSEYPPVPDSTPDQLKTFVQ
jgi:lipopolysaccharide transport system ATP-binding protein